MLAVSPSGKGNSSLEVMIARQPIYNNRMGIYGYELLFRSAHKSPSETDENEATAQVLNTALTDFNFADLVCGRKVVINITRLFAEEITNYPLVPENTVLDFPDDIEFDANLIARIKELRSLGYKISLGGFKVLRRASRILPLADIYRVDVRRMRPQVVGALVKQLERFPDLSLLAIKVETLVEYKLYSEAGFHYLQGYFLSRPRKYQTRDLPTSKLAVLNLLAKVNDDNTLTEEIQQIIAQDVGMSFKLLKLVNSSFFGFVDEIESIQHAVVLLGRQEIRRLVSVFALSKSTDQPVAMIEIAFMRAKLCELLAKRAGRNQDEYFTAGMFSAIDILLQQPLPVLLKKLPFSTEIKQAILFRQGPMGRMLRLVKSLEKGKFDKTIAPDVAPEWVNEEYLKAIRWTHELMHSFD